MKFLLVSILCLTQLQAQDPYEGNVSSQEASYDGSNLVLEGTVKLNHGLGEIEAEKATLSKQDSAGKELPFSLIHLEKNIRIDCKNNAKISCGRADLDFAALQGTLWAAEEEHVSFSDVLPSGLSIQIFSKQTLLSLEPKATSGYTVNHLTAIDNVVLCYGDDYVLQAEKATYQKNAKANNPLSGLIQAFGAPCTLFYQKKPIIMTSVSIDTEKELLHLTNPKGALSSNLFSSKKEESDLFFESKTLDWDQKKEVLCLKNDVVVQDSHFGTLATDEELIIRRKDNRIESIHVEGKSILSHQQSQLTCLGSLHVDGLKGEISVLSPEKEQLTYTDPSLTVQADQALLEYDPSSNQISALTLHKNVHIRSHDPQSTKRYGLADHLRYIPGTKTVILLADAGKKVLFWDEEQNITISAKEVHLLQNPLTGKTEIQGIGNLRLSLSSEEFSLLKNRFPDQSTQLQRKEEASHE